MKYHRLLIDVKNNVKILIICHTFIIIFVILNVLLKINIMMINIIVWNSVQKKCFMNLIINVQNNVVLALITIKLV